MLNDAKAQAMPDSHHIDYETLRSRHASERPLRQLKDGELMALLAAELPEDDAPHRSHTRALRFLARLETEERV